MEKLPRGQYSPEFREQTRLGYLSPAAFTQRYNATLLVQK